MVQSLGNHSESKRLDTSDGLVPILAIRHDAGQGRDLGKPAAVGFALNFDRESHVGNVPLCSWRLGVYRLSASRRVVPSAMRISSTASLSIRATR